MDAQRSLGVIIYHRDGGGNDGVMQEYGLDNETIIRGFREHGYPLPAELEGGAAAAAAASSSSSSASGAGDAGAAAAAASSSGSA